MEFAAAGQTIPQAIAAVDQLYGNIAEDFRREFNLDRFTTHRRILVQLEQPVLDG